MCWFKKKGFRWKHSQIGPKFHIGITNMWFVFMTAKQMNNIACFRSLHSFISTKEKYFNYFHLIYKLFLFWGLLWVVSCEDLEDWILPKVKKDEGLRTDARCPSLLSPRFSHASLLGKCLFLLSCVLFWLIMFYNLNKFKQVSSKFTHKISVINVKTQILLEIQEKV